jgi:hypothetical protein
MINKEKLGNNLNELRNMIPLKPQVYTKEHPVTIQEALHKYSNRRSVNGMEVCTMNLNKNNWPLPLWFNPANIKVGFFNRLFYKRHLNSWKKSAERISPNINKKFRKFKDFEYLWIPIINESFFKRNIDATMLEAFNANRKYIERKLKSNNLLSSKTKAIEEIFKTYKKKFWISCINTIFPLLDYVARKLLNTNKLTIDVKQICKLFEQNGFSIETIDYLMPHVAFIKAMEHHNTIKEEVNKPTFLEVVSEIDQKVKGNNFSLIGPALSSFLLFANHYYGYYKNDDGDKNIINQINVIKLITFLYLLLELEPIFKIVLDEN